MADDINDIGRRIANAIQGGTPIEKIQANLEVLSRGLANRLPEDVGFCIVLFDKHDRDLNAFASDLETRDAIDRLARVRDQLRNGGIKMEWSKDQDIIDSRIVRVN